MWFSKPFFKYATAILLLLLIGLLFFQLFPILSPVIAFINIVLLPLVLGGLLYYLFRPFIRYLERFNISRTFGILILYALIILGVIFAALFIYPILERELGGVLNYPSFKMEEVKEKTISLFRIYNLSDLYNEFRVNLNSLFQYFVLTVKENIGNIISQITKIAISLAVTPFVLYYLLKEDYKFPVFFLKLIPEDYKINAEKIFRDVDMTLSHFITGQAFLAFIIGFLSFLGFLVIGLKHLILLSLTIMIFSIIPYVGAIIGALPAIFVGLSISFFMGLKVIIIITLAHVITNHLISPYVLGAWLNIHPLTLILLLLASGFLWGIFGLFLAIPIYAIAKVVFLDVRQILQEKKVL